jgi:amino acid transporter
LILDFSAFIEQIYSRITMERVQPQYNDGLEVDHYQGMEVHEYGGMDVNPYPGAGGDGSNEKVVFSASTDAQIYNEDAGSRLHRDLKTRQICMIALGGALGTGLLINT